jgi:hypothetical protein
LDTEYQTVIYDWYDVYDNTNGYPLIERERERVTEDVMHPAAVPFAINRGVSFSRHHL